MKRILFIGHDASRTGAPLILLHLIDWLRANHPKLVIDLLLLRGGELESSYGESANVYVLSNDKGASLFRRGIAYLKDEYFGKRKLRTADIPPFKQNYDVVLGNTAATLEYLEFFKKRGLRTISWLHELEYVISLFFSRERFAELSGSVDCFIAVSKAVELMLEDFVCKTRTEVVYEFANTNDVPEHNINDVKTELGILNNAFIVGSGGTVEWRKGTDVFLQIASRVAKDHSNIYFIWVGGKSDRSSSEFNQVLHDLKRLGIEGRVVFTGITNEPFRFLSAIDVFALTSREDPFPIMCLEAASCGKPVICFENAGGMPEFVEDDAGFAVPYLDTGAVAEKIVDLYLDPQLCKQMGAAAAAKARNRHSISNSAPKILKIIEEIIDN